MGLLTFFFMQTVLRTLERAYSKIKVKQSGIDLSSEEIADGISEMNAFMWLQDADGLGVGWSDVSSSDQTLPVADWVIPFVENGTALRLGTEFGVEIDPRLAGMFEEALRVVEKNNVVIPTIKYPSILPTGGEESSRYCGSKYFSDEDQNTIGIGTQGFLRNELGEKTTHSTPTSDVERGH